MNPYDFLPLNVIPEHPTGIQICQRFLTEIKKNRNKKKVINFILSEILVKSDSLNVVTKPVLRERVTNLIQKFNSDRNQFHFNKISENTKKERYENFIRNFTAPFCLEYKHKQVSDLKLFVYINKESKSVANCI